VDEGLNIGELEKASGVPRSTIYYYVRDGLLPVAQKKAASRAVYSEDHLALLAEITRLKGEGLTLQAIRQQVASQVAALTAANAGTAGEYAEQVRQSILRAAARLFARKGYRATRIDDIIEEVGITPPVFYGHFPSKQDLFVEAFGVFIDWMQRSLEKVMPESGDAVDRELPRAQSYYFGVKSVGANLLTLLRSEAVREDGALREMAQDTLKHIVADTLGDLIATRREHGVRPLVEDELVAFGIFGAVDGIVMRACWDEQYSAEDVLQTVCGLLILVKALYSGRLDISEDMKAYADLIHRLAAGPAQLPEEGLL
jgi:AcrR family transcriptional regulator